MPTSNKIGIGAVLIAVGLAGMIYTMPVVASGAAADELVVQESSVPKLPDSLLSYVGIEIASFGTLALGIVTVAIGHYDTFNQTIEKPKEESDFAKEEDRKSDTDDNVQGAAAS